MDPIQLPRTFAVHPAWYGELETLIDSQSAAETYRENRLKSYMAAAYPFRNHAFVEGDVYQINEHEYYSYTDGIRYYLTASGDRIALIQLYGLLEENIYWSDYANLAAKIQSAEQEAYAGVLLLANCPGGTVQGMDKLNKAIAEYSKPIGAWVSGYLTSAAAYVTAPCDFILADPDTKNTFGSIGVFGLVQNYAKHYEQEGIDTRIFRNVGATEKFKPNSHEAWDQKDLEEFQASVDADGKTFHEAMSKQRGLSATQMAQVKTGDTYQNEDAIGLGLIDGFSSLEEAVQQTAIYQPLFI